ncbi:MAG: DUF72 domain-containing protein [Gemmatimonadaceae bacterium]
MSSDPGVAEAQKRAADVEMAAASPIDVGGSRIRFGTASWTDPTITAPGVFYPANARSPEARLRFYASRFSVVEVDSTYYAIPARAMAEHWVERTPANFVFNVKAHALMTGQPTEVKRLPSELLHALPAPLASRARLYGHELPPELYDAAWRMFMDAIAPLRAAGKFGSLLLQYPRWFLPGKENREAILDAHHRLGEVPCAVEFRNALWFNAGNSEKTLKFLADHRIPFVMVDEPQGMASSVPPVVAVTASELAVVRFHGRRSETWEAKNVTATERYRYLYDRGELAEWVERIREAAERAREVHVLMNNCYANYGTTNAREMAALLQEMGQAGKR